MNNRWCIISGARSGSRYLEDLIFNGLPRTKLKPSIKLGEFLSEDFIMYLDSNGTDIFKKQDIASVERREYMDRVLQEIQENDTTSVVTRIFVQPHLISTKTPLDLVSAELQKFKNLNFNFIFLQRNIFDRAISALVAHKTNRWLRLKQEKSVWQTMTIDSESFICQINYINKQLEITKNLINSVAISCSLVNYETMFQDCLNNNIPMSTESNLVKTYDVPYQKIILNYHELVTAYEKLTEQ